MTRRRPRALVMCAVAASWGAWVCVHAFTRAPWWHAALFDRPLNGFPFWPEALVRAAAAVGGALVTGLAAWQLGSLLTARTERLFNGIGERVQFTLALGAVALSSLLMACAWVGAYRPLIVSGLLALCMASRPRGLLADVRTAGARLRRWRWPTRPSALNLLCLVCLLGSAGFTAVAALAPEVEYDALWYHLWLPTRWLLSGRTSDIVEEYISLYPGGWELLNGAALTVGGPVAAKGLHFACLWLVGASAALLARCVAPRVSRWAVAAICICVPTMLWLASSAYVDLALAWFTTVASVGLFRFHGTNDKRWLLCAGVTAGGALTVKHLGLVALAVQASFLLATQTRLKGVRHALLAVVVFTTLAVGIAVPWYARAYAASGNPVFPQLYEVFGATPADRWSSGTERALRGFDARFGMGRTLSAIVKLPWNITTHAARFGGSVGPVFLVLVPFAPWWRPRGRRLLVIAAGTASYIAVWASPLGSFQLRFLTPVIPCCAVLAAAGAREVAASARRLHPRLSGAPYAAVGLLLLLNLPPFIDWHEKDRQGWNWWLTHVLHSAPLAVVVGAESEDAYLSRSVPTYRAWRAIDSATPAGSRILTFAGGDHLYSHRPRLWSDATVAYDATWGAAAGSEARMFDALRTLGITHVLMPKDARQAPGMSSLAIASPTTRACCLLPFYQDEHAEVFTIAYPAPDADESAFALAR